MGFEPTIPAFERAKTLYALDRAATVICKLKRWEDNIKIDLKGCWLGESEVNETRIRSCPMTSFGINNAGPQRYLPYKPKYKTTPYFSNDSIIKNTKNKNYVVKK
jgi:hypothetical protein